LVATERASDTAYELIRSMILELRLPPGAFVNEQSLASEIGFGRVPVREALARLAQDRFINVIPRRGNEVTALALEDVLDMFEAREAIQCGVAYIAATKATPLDLQALRDLVTAADLARASTDPERFLQADHAVHMFLVHLIRNPLLQDAAVRLLLHSLRFWRWYWATTTATTEAMMSHSNLLLALEEGAPERAETAMRDHLHASRQLVQLLF
jgi:DNA-binding GntR family transcriptional regulator